MIDVADLTFAYSGSEDPAVRGLGFTVGRGEILGFLGPSGAGKSTTQKVLIRLLKGYSGCATVMGRDLASWGSDYYERVGVSFELPNHYQKLTALDNLNFFRSLYQKATEDPMRLLEMVGLGEAQPRSSGRKPSPLPISKPRLSRYIITLLLFTGVRGEKVWKIRMGAPLCEGPWVGKTGCKAPLSPLCATKNTPSRPVHLFSKQFLKGDSQKFANRSTS